MLIGLISDTHGLMRPEALAALRGVELILHAGDVGARKVLEELRRVAPLRAVFGNVDDAQDPDLGDSIDLDVNGLSIHVSHGHELGSPTPEKLLARYSHDVIVYGHTHRALVHREEGRLVVNPGAAGPARFNLEPGVALLTIEAGRAEVTLVALK
jgi:putative phosphoesterase